MGEDDSLNQNEVKNEVRKIIYQLAEEKGGDVEAYKQIINDACEYLRHVFGFMISNLIAERIQQMTRERFPSFVLPLRKDAFDLSALKGDKNNNINIEILKFYIDCVIELTEKLGGDTVLKGLVRRLNHIGSKR